MENRQLLKRLDLLLSWMDYVRIDPSGGKRDSVLMQGRDFDYIQETLKLCLEELED